eukprot:TRINITY_DN7782_c0_g1_i1.p1 TRINITY_DN7782_c0_g1~~TRINITY_DN7782_c0_g1_i1.p1  ORF type:complete len:197 (-),score=12.98 TRINITY_DN7782_c0_g1_i1:18-533(-)
MCLYTMPFSALAKWLHFCAMLAGSIIAWPIRWRFPVAAEQVWLTVEATGQSTYRLLPFLGFLLLNTLVVWDGAFVPEDGKAAAANQLQPQLTKPGPFASMIAEAGGRSGANAELWSDTASDCTFPCGDQVSLNDEMAHEDAPQTTSLCSPRADAQVRATLASSSGLLIRED